MTQVTPLFPSSEPDDSWRCGRNLPLPSQQPWPLTQQGLSWGEQGKEGYTAFVTDPQVEWFLKNRLASFWRSKARGERARKALLTDGQDVYQAVLFKILVQWNRRVDPGLSKTSWDSYAGWLAVVVRNAVIDHFRTSNYDRLAALPEFEMAAPDEVHLGVDIARAWLDKLLPQLSEDELDLINEFCLNGKSGQEIAEQRGTTKNAIYKKISRIITKLRSLLPPGVDLTDLPDFPDTPE